MYTFHICKVETHWNVGCKKDGILVRVGGFFTLPAAIHKLTEYKAKFQN
jgi:hypothetical protein